MKENITAADCLKCGACCVAPYEHLVFYFQVQGSTVTLRPVEALSLAAL